MDSCIISFPIKVANSKFICHFGKANLSVLSLWRFSTVRFITDGEFSWVIVKRDMLLTFKPLKRTFRLLRLIVNAGFTSRQKQQKFVDHDFLEFLSLLHFVYYNFIETCNITTIDQLNFKFLVRLFKNLHQKRFHSASFHMLQSCWFENVKVHD